MSHEALLHFKTVSFKIKQHIDIFVNCLFITKAFNSNTVEMEKIGMCYVACRVECLHFALEHLQCSERSTSATTRQTLVWRPERCAAHGPVESARDPCTSRPLRNNVL